MEYKKLSGANLPPVDNSRYFILWLAANESDGGFPALAKRVQYDGRPPYIRYVKPFDGWLVLDEAEYRHCLWAECEVPAQVKGKWEKERLKMEAIGDPLMERAG